MRRLVPWSRHLLENSVCEKVAGPVSFRGSHRRRLLNWVIYSRLIPRVFCQKNATPLSSGLPSLKKVVVVCDGRGRGGGDGSTAYLPQPPRPSLIYTNSPPTFNKHIQYPLPDGHLLIMWTTLTLVTVKTSDATIALSTLLPPITFTLKLKVLTPLIA